MQQYRVQPDGLVVADRHDATLHLPQHPSVTTLRCGADCVIVAGLCGRLRAWSIGGAASAPRSFLEAKADFARDVRTPSSSASQWRLVLDESSEYELPHGRVGTHPYACVTEVAADGAFAFATSETAGRIHVWCSRRWKRLQLLDPADGEGEREQWLKRGVRTVRASTTCAHLAHGHLAAGTREGDVRVWRAGDGGDGGYARRGRALRADEGPVAAVVLTARAVIAAYRQAAGLVDGDDFRGEQSVVCWALDGGAPVWRLPQPGVSPLIAALPVAGGYALLHAAAADADAVWQHLDATPPVAPVPAKAAAQAAAEAAEEAEAAAPAPAAGAARLRVASLVGAASAEAAAAARWAEVVLAPTAAADGGRPMAWASDGGGAAAVGLAGGSVAVLAAADARPTWAVHGDGAEIGAVLLARARADALVSGAGDGEGDDLLLVSASASGSIRVWRHQAAAAAEGGGGGGGSLVMLHECIVAAQPTALGIVRDGSGAPTGLVVGTNVGELMPIGLPLPATAASLEAAAARGGRETRAAMAAAPAAAEPKAAAPKAAEPPAAYEWRFDNGTGERGCGFVAEKRGAFDGWAQTDAYEKGLQLVLRRARTATGNHNMSGGGGGGNGGASAAVAAAARAGLRRGMRVRIDGLTARADLNGQLGEVLGPIDPSRGRLPVRLRDGPQIWARPEHCRPVS